jgi:hypothetical protein
MDSRLANFDNSVHNMDNRLANFDAPVHDGYIPADRSGDNCRTYGFLPARRLCRVSGSKAKKN